MGLSTSKKQENQELVSVKIKLKRLGNIRNPQYRIVIADARKKRDGRVIEEVGIYHPKEEPSLIRVDGDRVAYWLGVGAQPTDPVRAILKVTGDWQKFKGEPGAEGTLRVAEPKADKVTLFAAAVSDGEKAKNEPSPKPKKLAPVEVDTAEKDTAEKDTAEVRDEAVADANKAEVAEEQKAAATDTAEAEAGAEIVEEAKTEEAAAEAKPEDA
jgi:small subunit ribosomal protein S16